METEYHGEPVAGGTYPAEIWRDFILGRTRSRQRAKPSEPGTNPPPP